MKKNIVFFGGSGFLGNYFCEVISSMGCKLIVIDTKYPQKKIKNVKYIKGDMCNKKLISKYIKKGSYVFNFAGNASIESSNEFPLEAQQANIIGNSTILEVCKKKKISRYVYASSLYVFSKYGGFYKATKQSCEIIINEYNKNHNIPFTIIRFGSLYGPGAGKGNAIYDLISMAFKKKKINYWGEGTEVRQYIHARDASKICQNIFDDTYKNNYILLSGHEDIKIKDLLDTISEMLPFKIKIECKLDKRSVNHYKNTPYTIVDNQNFIPELGEKIVFNSYTDLRQGLYECMNHFKKNNL